MHPRLINTLAIAALFIVLSGCSTNSQRSEKTTINGPKNTHSSDTQFYAKCTGDGHNGTWKGPVRTAKEWAVRDANEHEKEYPGHHATIER